MPKINSRKQSTNRRKGKDNIIDGMILLCLFSSFYSCYVSITLGEKVAPENMKLKKEVLFVPDVCSKEHKDIILHQLPKDACSNSAQPWLNKCSFSFASRCPNTTWIEAHYTEKLKEQKTFIKDRLIKLIWGKDESPFLGISIGCNKGFDAINTIRMGTFDPVFDKERWRQARQDETIDNRCGMKNDHTQFGLDSTSLHIRPRRGEMYCVEGLPTNYKKLKSTAQELELDKKGFIVSHAAIAAKNGEVYFPNGEEAKEGIENLGIASCKPRGVRKQLPKGCMKVDSFNLDSYVDRFINNTNVINHLSIDIEGYDADALMGGKNVLRRTEYLEFEYNWMGSWASYKLSDIIQMLDDNKFTCYWIGNDEVWRITDCWIDYYDNHFWSNIGCAHRVLFPEMVSKMEDLFQKTLKLNRLNLNYINTEYSTMLANRYIKKLRTLN